MKVTKIKRLSSLAMLLLLISIFGFNSCKNDGENSQFKYETVANDPLNARIYTLENGLKVYLTVYKDAPRIQTFIPVKVGGKNDPAETTGLAHYFEHLMFKGTKHFGTQNYEKEEPLLAQIEELFETYRNTTDAKQRKAIYKQIDSVSQEASKFAIPNEYDKLMSTIGASGTNAFTSEDMTCYVENIPSNQIENWAKIQADRFANAVIRGFHTELETVYEEKNMSLTRDSWKVYEAISAALFPHHPYGTQTVLGTQEHLKNPSIRNIKNYYDTYYVANNMAICMSGDFDPDETIKIIAKYFGKLKTNPNIPTVKTTEAKPITEPVIKEVFGNDAEFVSVAWRMPGMKDQEFEIGLLTDYIIANEQAGLIDLNVNQKQKVINGYAYYVEMVDYGYYVCGGNPKQGQTLDQVKDIFLEQIELLRKGEFEDWMLEATINNFRLNEIRKLEHNSPRAMSFANAFQAGIEWKDYVGRLDRMKKITKQQIVDFANKYFGNNNYAVIYKKVGKDPNEKKIEKPEITPINANRDAESAFFVEIKNTTVKPIEPVFLDFNKDLNVTDIKKDLPLLYKKNVENELFQLNYLFDMGSNNDKELNLAFDYLKYLGTSKRSPEDVKTEFYKMGCSFDVYIDNDRSYIILDGLSENMPRAIELMEELLTAPVANESAFEHLILDLYKKRADSKLNQYEIFSKLQNYARYGKFSTDTYILNNEELKALKADVLINKIKGLKQYKHRILYYGPMEQNKFVSTVREYHKVPDNLLPVIPKQNFVEQITTENSVLFAPYNSNQIYLSMYSIRDEKFDVKKTPIATMYNNYFGGAMNSIVFQEMREARGLAYSAYARYVIPDKLDENYVFYSFIATQNDKMDDAVKAYNEIINNMPSSEKAFDIAKESIISQLRTRRITKSGVLWWYIAAQDLGLNYDHLKLIFENVQNLTLADVEKFQKENIKDRKYTYCILGDDKTLDFKKMSEYGKVQKLALVDIFGY